MGLIVDTGFFIRIERMKATAWRSSLPAGERAGISSITVSEIVIGQYFATNSAIAERRKTFIEDVLAFVPVVDFDTAIARTHARIRAELKQKGKMIGAHELIIAATAMSLGWDVLTLNGAEFRHVEGLGVREA
jgi:tRNA(fMet)-specific endonuclease VapC